MRLLINNVSLFTAALVTIGVTGCERAEPVQWTSSDAVLALPDQDLQQEVRDFLQENSGTIANPVLVTRQQEDFDFSLHLKHGQAVYTKRCVQCHGVNGDGNGPAADHLYPRPRDYTKAVFKFTSTPYGSKPQRKDLIRTVRQGVIGTSMPSFDRIPEKDVEAVVDYVLVLAQRGELEGLLASEADAAGELDLEYAAEYVTDVITGWEEAEQSLTHPLSPQPNWDEERVRLGREAFLSKGCSKCHGEDGRGHTKDNIGKDSWGFSTRAADLTSGMLRGGQRPIDVYRRILNGINGTPMPGFGRSLENEPETLWNLVAYVMEVSNRRRFGESIPAGLIKPFETPESQANEDDDSE